MGGDTYQPKRCINFKNKECKSDKLLAELSVPYLEGLAIANAS